MLTKSEHVCFYKGYELRSYPSDLVEGNLVEVLDDQENWYAVSIDTKAAKDWIDNN